MIFRKGSTLLLLIVLLSGSHAQAQARLAVRIEGPSWAQGKKVKVTAREIFTWKDSTLESHPLDETAFFTLEPGRYVIKVSGQGVAPAFAGPVDIDAHPNPAEVTLKLERGDRISGKIRDIQGKPLEGVEVSILGDTINLPSDFYRFEAGPFSYSTANSTAGPPIALAGWSILAGAASGRDGAFYLEGVPYGNKKYTKILFEKEGYRRLDDGILRVPGGCAEGEWVLCPGNASIQVVFKAEANEPMPGAWIFWVDPRSPGMDPHFPSTKGMPCCAGPSGHDGTIRIFDPPGGSSTYWAVAWGYEWSGAEGAPGDTLNLTLAKAKASRKITLVDSQEGKPVPGARIHVKTVTLFPTPIQVSRLGEGSFLLEGALDNLPVEVDAWAPLYTEKSFRLDPKEKESKDQETVLTLDSGLRGKLLITADTEASFENLQVSWRQEKRNAEGKYETETNSREGQAVTTSTGPGRAAVEISGFQPGRLNVTVNLLCPDYVHEQFPFDVKSDGFERSLKLRLLDSVERVWISGTVSDEQGSPLVGAFIQSSLQDGPSESDENGLFRVRCGKSGDAIRIERCGFVARTISIPVQDTPLEDLKVVLTRGAVLEVLDPHPSSEDPRAREMILLYRENAEEEKPFRTANIHEGFAHIVGLPPASYQLILDRDGKTTSLAGIALGTGERATVRVDEKGMLRRVP